MTVPADASRRELLKVVGVGVAGAAVATAATSNVTTAHRAHATAPADVEPTNELADLVGVQLGPYRVHSVGLAERGGIPVVLSTVSGETFRVDVLRFDPSDGASGIGAVGYVSVYLRNGGDGRTATNEEHGLGAMALAEELRRREQAGWRPSFALLTRGERNALDRVGRV